MTRAISGDLPASFNYLTRGPVFVSPLPFENTLPQGLKHLVESPQPPPSRLKDFFYQFIDPNVTPAQTKKLLGIGGGLGLLTSLFTGGLGLNLDTLLNLGAIASLICPALVIPVAIGFGLKALGNLWDAGKSLLNGDLAGCATNLFAGGLTMLFVLPFGKLGAISKLWKNAKTTEGFLYGATKLCYGTDVSKGLAKAVKAYKSIGKNPGSATGLAKAANGQAKNFITRLRDSIYDFFTRQGQFAPQQAAQTARAAAPSGYQYSLGGVLMRTA